MNGDSEVTARPITHFKGKLAVIMGEATGIGLAIAVEDAQIKLLSL